MFYTCTTNPAIDLFISTKEMKPFLVNRTEEDEAQANGKGVNISFLLKKLGIDNTALGFIGGFTGRYIEEELQQAGVTTDFITVSGNTRINVFTRVEADEVEYKLVNQGPTIHPDEVEELLQKISQLTNEDTLFVSGSNPKGMNDSFLLEVAKLSQQNGFRLILDSSSPVVLECLPYHPACIKPNEEEIASWFGKITLNKEELLTYGKKLIKMGAERVLLSLGGEGSLLLTKKEMYIVTAPEGEVVNTAGAGDTLLATFAGLVLSGQSVEAALKTASAAASSTAFTSGLTDFSNVPRLMQQVTVTKIG